MRTDGDHATLTVVTRYWEHLEGRHSVVAALRAFQRRFQVILIRGGVHSDRVREIVELAEQRQVPVRYVASEELNSLAHGATHGGVIAICSPKPRVTAEELLDRIGSGESGPLLLLEGVDDARNLGFTLRSAEALGAKAVLIKKHLWDFDPVEVARPASGAFERLALVQIDGLKPLKSLRQRGFRLIGLIAGARQSLYASDLRGPCVLAIGGEKRGLSGAVRSICDVLVKIPMLSPAGSLSLSHAAAIVLAEAARQRSMAGGDDTIRA